jgi:glycosyltransferase involved in cell wall biosynthesis
MYIPKMISVTVLTKNSEKHLIQCIDSILMQKYPDFEIIIVDSASTDKTISILESYKDSRIKIIKSETNLLIGNSRQICLNNSSGEILAIVDSDVELPHEHWLENMVKPLLEGYNPTFSISETFDIPDIIIPKEQIAGVQTLAKAKDTDPEILK